MAVTSIFSSLFLLFCVRCFDLLLCHDSCELTLLPRFHMQLNFDCFILMGLVFIHFSKF